MIKTQNIYRDIWALQKQQTASGTDSQDSKKRVKAKLLDNSRSSVKHKLSFHQKHTVGVIVPNKGPQDTLNRGLAKTSAVPRDMDHRAA